MEAAIALRAATRDLARQAEAVPLDEWLRRAALPAQPLMCR
jgi:hypothetical protein